MTHESWLWQVPEKRERDGFIKLLHLFVTSFLASIFLHFLMEWEFEKMESLIFNGLEWNKCAISNQENRLHFSITAYTGHFAKKRLCFQGELDTYLCLAQQIAESAKREPCIPSRKRKMYTICVGWVSRLCWKNNKYFSCHIFPLHWAIYG